jgi:hypothetical protein
LIKLTDAVEQHQPFDSLRTIVNFLQQTVFSSVEPAALNNALFRQNSNFGKFLLHVACPFASWMPNVKDAVGPLVEHAEPDGAKAKMRQKSFMTGHVVAAKGQHWPIKSKNKRVETNKPLLNMFNNASNLVGTRLAESWRGLLGRKSTSRINAVLTQKLVLRGKRQPIFFQIMWTKTSFLELPEDNSWIASNH